MALLGASRRVWSRRRPMSRLGRLFAVVALLSAHALGASTPGLESREYQIKAVFLFNFAQFVEWPHEAFSNDESPLVIGVLGEDPFGPYLDETVRGEKVNKRPLVIRRFRKVEDIQECHVLIISRSESSHLGEVLA